jgi:hypothetical protein
MLNNIFEELANNLEIIEKIENNHDNSIIFFRYILVNISFNAEIYNIKYRSIIRNIDEAVTNY